MTAHWQQEKERIDRDPRAEGADRRGREPRPTAPSATATSSAPPSSGTARLVDLEKQLEIENARLEELQPTARC